MGVCVCCGRRGAYGCDCRPGACEGCRLCVGHCRCQARPAAAPDPGPGLDDPAGPFAGLDVAGRATGGRPDAVDDSARKAELLRLSLVGRADDLLARMDHVTPGDGDEMCSLFLERGWVEAVRHLVKGEMLNPARLAEAGRLLAASDDWADGLTDDARGHAAPPRAGTL